MHLYRTHTCEALRESNASENVRLSGWVHRKRDHGGLLFIDLRDHYGITQCVIEEGHPLFAEADKIPAESVITIDGEVIKRTPETINDKLPTGRIEVKVKSLTLQSKSAVLPLQVFGDETYPESTRLTYRFLDLRREENHKNIVLRSRFISSLRARMNQAGFMEIQTPILTASSPEGARDYLVPSRVHPGKFYALPQAPQMFKQLLMVSGFDRYFQIAPCFRDEDARADRSPGEFYQLDLEMSFVEQEDVFKTIEPILTDIFEEFSNHRSVTRGWPRITYADSMLHYGCDKPDLRNPLKAMDVTDIFRGSDFSLFAGAVEKGSVVRAIAVPGAAKESRGFFDKMNDWARSEGAPGLGYITFPDAEGKGPVASKLDQARKDKLLKTCGASVGDALFFICNTEKLACRHVALTLKKLGDDLNILEKNSFRFCWIIDYPMYEYNEDLKKIDFSHNPFSMPQGGMAALLSQDPLDIKAYQYDIVCNGYELCSGAIRNHLPEVMIKAFEIAGYTENDVKEKFAGLFHAFQYGAPPHGGCAPGIERMVMLLADTPNIREVVAFPMTQTAEDLLMKAPAQVSDKQLKELHIRVHLPPQEKKDKVA